MSVGCRLGLGWALLPCRLGAARGGVGRHQLGAGQHVVGSSTPPTAAGRGGGAGRSQLGEGGGGAWGWRREGLGVWKHIHIGPRTQDPGSRTQVHCPGTSSWGAVSGCCLVVGCCCWMLVVGGWWEHVLFGCCHMTVACDGVGCGKQRVAWWCAVCVRCVWCVWCALCGVRCVACVLCGVQCVACRWLVHGVRVWPFVACWWLVHGVRVWRGVAWRGVVCLGIPPLL